MAIRRCAKWCTTSKKLNERLYNVEFATVEAVKGPIKATKR
jgi:hypothetical protein